MGANRHARSVFDPVLTGRSYSRRVFSAPIRQSLRARRWHASCKARPNDNRSPVLLAGESARGSHRNACSRPRPCDERSDRGCSSGGLRSWGGPTGPTLQRLTTPTPKGRAHELPSRIHPLRRDSETPALLACWRGALTRRLGIAWLLATLAFSCTNDEGVVYVDYGIDVDTTYDVSRDFTQYRTFATGTPDGVVDGMFDDLDGREREDLGYVNRRIIWTPPRWTAACCLPKLGSLAETRATREAGARECSR